MPSGLKTSKVASRQFIQSLGPSQAQSHVTPKKTLFGKENLKTKKAATKVVKKRSINLKPKGTPKFKSKKQYKENETEHQRSIINQGRLSTVPQNWHGTD
jgi:hypothetical protein